MVIGARSDPFRAGPKAHQSVPSHPLELYLHVREIPERIVIPNRFPLRMVVNYEVEELSLQFGPLGGWLLPVIEPKIGPHIKVQVFFQPPLRWVESLASGFQSGARRCSDRDVPPECPGAGWEVRG